VRGTTKRPREKIIIIDESTKQSRLVKQVLDSSSSDDEEEFFFNVVHLVIDGDQFDEESRRRSSVHGRQTVRRNREEGHARLYQDYFADYPTYSSSYFRQRYGINYSMLVTLNCNNLIWV
jgi:hypothetical protein